MSFALRFITLLAKVASKLAVFSFQLLLWLFNKVLRKAASLASRRRPKSRKKSAVIRKPFRQRRGRRWQKYRT